MMPEFFEILRFTLMFSSFAFCFASKIDDDDALDDGEAPAGA